MDSISIFADLLIVLVILYAMVKFFLLVGSKTKQETVITDSTPYQYGECDSDATDSIYQ